MQDLQKLPAKLMKRVGQIGRLGAGGLVHTAYVRALGPTAYALTDPARNVAAAMHRKRALTRALPERLEGLKARVPSALVRRDPGVRLGFNEPGAFVQALEAAVHLTDAGCSVARLVSVDWSARAFTPEAVAGQSWRDHVRSGSAGEQDVLALEEVLQAIHRAGYVLGTIGENDVRVGQDGTPVVLNLSNALPLAGLSRDMSVFLRDADRLNFNELFGTRLVTAGQLRMLLSPSASIPHDKVRGFSEVYAPVIIRDDIRWGKIWNTDLGIGRWNFIMKDHLPIPVGGSVLDLGSNNGFNPLQMLRAGAASAVGVEIEPQAVEQSKLLKSAYEWLDNRAYDFRPILGSQGDIAKFGLPRFDVVTAFCSLYYLPDAEIRELVRYIRTLTGVLVLQCNTDRLIDRGGDEEIYRKASLPFAIEVLEQAGFTERQIIAPPGYSRPLVIGRAPAA